MSERKPQASEQKRQPPLNIPLDFDKAVEGLLGVDPKKPSPSPEEKAVKGAKKSAPKRKKK